MTGPVLIQSPAIGNALRSTLSLDAAGSMGLDMGPTVHPVCIVGDVRAQIDSGVRTYSGYANIAAVAAQYSQVALGLVNAPSASFLYAIPRRTVIWLGVSGVVYWRLGLNSPPVGVTAIPRQLNSQVSAAGALAVVGGTNATAPVGAAINGATYVPTNTRVEINWPEMRIVPPSPFATLASLYLHCDQVNVGMIAEMMWDEVYEA